MPKDEYEGPFETQEEEDAAYKRFRKLRDRKQADDDAAAAAAKAKKKKGDLPIVE